MSRLAIAIFYTFGALIAISECDIEPKKISRKNSQDAWQQFLETYNRKYRNAGDEKAHMITFRSNWGAVERHNREGAKATFRMRVNGMADKTLEELGRTRLGQKKPPPQEALQIERDVAMRRTSRIGMRNLATGTTTTAAEPEEDYPAELDWRTRSKTCVSPVKDQGYCAASWAFSAVASLESRFCLKNNENLTVLSEQNVLDCYWTIYNQGCNGGWSNHALYFAQNNGGLHRLEAYPYRAETQEHNCAQTDAEPRYGFASSAYEMTKRYSEASLIAALQHGPVSVSFNANDTSFYFYDSGIYQRAQCDVEEINHAMLLVGYGVEQESGLRYWIVKNSWGEDWGEMGYAKILRGSNTCGILTWNAYPLF